MISGWSVSRTSFQAAREVSVRTGQALRQRGQELISSQPALCIRRSCAPQRMRSQEPCPWRPSQMAATVVESMLNVQKLRVPRFALVLPSLLRLVKGASDGCQFLGAPPETCLAAAAPF